MNSSEPSAEERIPSRTLLTVRSAEIGVAVILAVLSLSTIWSNYELGAGWSGYGPEPGYFPFRLGIVVLIASLVVIYHAIRDNDRSAFLEVEQAKMVAVILVPLIFFIIGIVYLGIYVASTIFIAAFMFFLGKFAWWKSALLSTGLMLAFFYIFEIQFKVPLPKGPLEAWLGY